ncbi:hypothetical protein Tdes44962_MAKER02713 [Teratosphaeria destructans]|uniref:Uncharacterized protein n=1 Tax=Teratosphaeria destructans TaxID=418781 RepID=A0A9W7SSB7_9PEZI|nr:hypothetical protein Tdes44962_MAKER02713 [Teratosphaeria destructans]
MIPPKHLPQRRARTQRLRDRQRQHIRHRERHRRRRRRAATPKLTSSFSGMGAGSRMLSSRPTSTAQSSFLTWPESARIRVAAGTCGSSVTNSAVRPLKVTKRSTSGARTSPRSPWRASQACRKLAARPRDCTRDELLRDVAGFADAAGEELAAVPVGVEERGDGVVEAGLRGRVGLVEGADVGEGGGFGGQDVQGSGEERGGVRGVGAGGGGGGVVGDVGVAVAGGRGEGPGGLLRERGDMLLGQASPLAGTGILRLHLLDSVMPDECCGHLAIIIRDPALFLQFQKKGRG